MVFKKLSMMTLISYTSHSMCIRMGNSILEEKKVTGITVAKARVLEGRLLDFCYAKACLTSSET